MSGSLGRLGEQRLNGIINEGIRTNLNSTVSLIHETSTKVLKHLSDIGTRQQVQKWNFFKPKNIANRKISLAHDGFCHLPNLKVIWENIALL